MVTMFGHRFESGRLHTIQKATSKKVAFCFIITLVPANAPAFDNIVFKTGCLSD